MKLTLSVVEVAEATGLSKSTVIRHIKSGALPSALVGGRRLVRVGDLEKFIDDRMAGEQVSA
jgi:excisionase family DNA binding protein